MKRCVACGTTDNLTRDHVVPRLVLRMLLERETYAHFCSKVRKVNIQPMCGECNNLKATRVIDLRGEEEHYRLLAFLIDYDIIGKVVFEDPDEFIQEVQRVQ